MTMVLFSGMMISTPKSVDVFDPAAMVIVTMYSQKSPVGQTNEIEDIRFQSTCPLGLKLMNYIRLVCSNQY